LISGLILLVAALCLVIGVVTTVSLYRVLLHQVDQAVGMAATRGGLGPHPDEDRLPPAQSQSGYTDPFRADETVTVSITGGQVTDARLAGATTTLNGEQQQVLLDLPVDGKPHTRYLDDLGGYRLQADVQHGTDGRADKTIIVGLPLAHTEQTIAQVVLVYTLLSLVALVLAAVVGRMIVVRALRPLDRVIGTARTVSALPLDSGEVALSVRVPDPDAHTEVGQVGSAINRMLGHVERSLTARHASEQRVRQFVADASHELRTPLAAIRGYAELTRRVRGQVPADVTHAIGRVESEATRMTTLVEDLLLLARLDSGRPLVHEPVELSRLIVDAVGDAHIADESHRYRLDLPEDPVVVPGDEQRLHQVLANLLANARTHTPAGTTVTVSLVTTADQAVLTVRDDGPGIPPALLPDIFQRFTRADTSRSRAAGSTGLGLSIVDAVVTAHAGEVSVDSTPGDTAFTVRLPLG
jgi:two-component system OmpR family sensor kinase